jgi:hypothetical protein
MAGIPKVKITFDADLDELKKGTKQAEAEVDGFSSKVSKFGKAAAAAFAVAAAAAATYAVKLGVDGVKAAIEDEAAQAKLAQTLTAVTGATNAQIKAVEDNILKMSLATGVSDDQLRPALSRLARSTGDTEKSQKLLATALDISAATGKPLEAVSNALGKAYDGNTAALGKLGLGLTAAELKTSSFADINDKLTQMFGGAAANAADTYQGKINRLKVAFEESKETIGNALLPILGKLMDFVNTTVVPLFTKFGEALGDPNSGINFYISTLFSIIKSVGMPIFNAFKSTFDAVKKAVMDNIDSFKDFGILIRDTIAPIVGNVLGGAFTFIGKVAAAVVDIIGGVIGVITTMVNAAVSGINAIIKAYNAIPILPNIPLIPTTPMTAPTVKGSSLTSSLPSGGYSASTGSVSSPNATGGGGGSSTAAISSATNPTGLLYKYGATATTDEALRSGILPTPGVVNNITVNGAIDAESTARQIVDVLNQSTYRGTGGSSRLIALG